MKPDKNFICVLPWNHIYVSNDGSYHPCCLSKNPATRLSSEKGAQLNIQHKTPFSQIQNSWQLKDMRQKMLAGKVPKECRYCHEIESHGRKSYREYVNELFPEMLEKIKKSSGVAELDLEFFDLRVGNLCNLKCRMCGPHSSLALQDEFNSYYGTPEVNLSMLNEETFDFVLSQVRTLKRINIAGGEPFLMKNVVSLITKLAALPEARNLTITFNTNLTILDADFMKLWKNFKKVEVAASIDGYGELNKYIRYPSQWDAIVKNVELCQPHAEVRVNCTVQLYNIFYLDRLFEYVERDLGLHLNLSILTDPSHLSVKVLPPALKLSATEGLQKLMLQYADCPDLEPLIKFMNSEDKSREFKKFRDWTLFLDESRSESLLSVAPVFAKYF